MSWMKPNDPPSPVGSDHQGDNVNEGTHAFKFAERNVVSVPATCIYAETAKHRSN